MMRYLRGYERQHLEAKARVKAPPVPIECGEGVYGCLLLPSQEEINAIVEPDEPLPAGNQDNTE